MCLRDFSVRFETASFVAEQAVSKHGDDRSDEEFDGNFE